jgi:hypothetical protein
MPVKSSICVLAVLSLLLSACAVRSEPVVIITGRYKEQPLSSLTDDLARNSSVAASFDFQGVTINATFTNFSKVSILLNFFCNSVKEANRFVVYINGSEDSYLDSGNETCGQVISLPVFTATKIMEGATEVSVRKITEPSFNAANADIRNFVTFEGFVVSSGESPAMTVRLHHRSLNPQPDTARRIEFVGDSITCGYCNLCKQVPPNTPNTYEIENFALSWPTLTCRALGATCHTEAWSGRGIIRNCDEKATTLMPEIFDRTRATVPADASLGDRWEFSRFVPDVVVINLGTNDFGCNPILNKTAFSAEYQRAYSDLVFKMLVEYASRNVKILLACGPMSVAYCPDVAEIISFVTTHGFPDQVFFLDHRGVLNESNTCCGHPSSAADVVMADIAVKTISNITRW